jgi:hypothetical protein
VVCDGLYVLRVVAGRTTDGHSTHDSGQQGSDGLFDSNVEVSIVLMFWSSTNQIHGDKNVIYICWHRVTCRIVYRGGGGGGGDDGGGLSSCLERD